MDEAFNFDQKHQNQESYLSDLEAAKTDDQELAEILDEYDFDESITQQYNRISQQFAQLKQEFLALQKVTKMRLEPHG